jgi:hypothetical protein
MLFFSAAIRIIEAVSKTQGQGATEARTGFDRATLPSCFFRQLLKALAQTFHFLSLICDK